MVRWRGIARQNAEAYVWRVKALTIQEMRGLELRAAEAGWPEERLLVEAGRRLGRTLADFFPTAGTMVGYLGKGHNAGDALVALGMLARDHGWRVELRAGFPAGECAPLTRAVWEREPLPPPLKEAPAWREMPRPLVLLDGLLGIGSCGPPRGPLAALAAEMNRLRLEAGAVVAAVDQPSGVDADSGEIHPGAVVADVTFQIGAPKAGLLRGCAANAVGALALVRVEPLTPPREGELVMICPESLRPAAFPRPFDFHKGNAGRVAVLAGSANYPGAAALAAAGALRGGAGLVHLCLPPGAEAAAMRCPPEIIIRSAQDPSAVLDCKPDALVIGPGLEPPSETWAEAMLEWIEKTDRPAVIDAGALNWLAERRRFGGLGTRHVLTPHPGEFARLAPDLADLPREDAARRFADRHACTLLLKGCRSLITAPGRGLWCTPTGHPGMAVGGQGDVLAGVIGARLAIGDDPLTAACFASWCCGRAAECAVLRSGAGENHTPTAGMDHLGQAMRDWRERRR